MSISNLFPEPRPIADALPSIDNDPDLWRRSSPAFAIRGCRGNCHQGQRACTCHAITLADIEQAERDSDLPIPPPHIWPPHDPAAAVVSDRYRDPDPQHTAAPAPDAEPPADDDKDEEDSEFYRNGYRDGWRYGVTCKAVLAMAAIALAAVGAFFYGVYIGVDESRGLIQRPTHHPQSPAAPAQPMTYLAGPPILATHG